MHNQLWLQQQDSKEKARTDQMNALLDQQMDRIEEHNARIAQSLERAQRELRAEEYRATQTEAAAQASIKKYYMEKEAYQVGAMINILRLSGGTSAVRRALFTSSCRRPHLFQAMIREKKAMAFKRKAGHPKEETAAEVEAHREPGPLSIDNRFNQIGHKSIGGNKNDAPAFTFGSLASWEYPRIIDKNLVVDLCGQISPGPATGVSVERVSSTLDKVNLHQRAPAYTMGARLVEPIDREQLAKPGPGGTHVTDRSLRMTRCRSSPSFSFASSTFTARAELKAKEDGSVPERRLLSSSHSARFPSPADYDVYPSLPHFADSKAPRATFGKADRFLPVDTSAKVAREAGPQTYTKANKGPGPQRYKPKMGFSIRMSALSAPLSLGTI